MKGDKFWISHPDVGIRNPFLRNPFGFLVGLVLLTSGFDLKNPKSNHFNPGFTDEERRGFTNIISSGFIDTFREFEKDGGHYTWWSYMFQARARNIGWRIDYFCVSKKILSTVNNSYILKDVMGSDHAPIVIETHDK